MDFTKAVSLFITVAVSFWATLSHGCYDRYLPCMQGYSISMSTITAEELPDSADICVAVSKAMVCVEKDAEDCPAGTPEPIVLQNFKNTLYNASDACINGMLMSASCLEKASECEVLSINLAAAVSGFDFKKNPTTLLSMVFRICPIINTGKKCQSDFRVMCPNGTLKSMERNKNLFQSVGRFCPEQAETITTEAPQPPEVRCSKKEKKCDALLSGVVKRNLRNGSTVTDRVCLELAEVVTCYQELINRCPNSSTKATKIVHEYSLIEQEICSPIEDGSCKLTVENCVQPFTSRCLHASVGHVDTVFECCGLAKTSLKCIRDSGCPDTFFPLGSKAGFESQFEDLCVGYDDYCPNVGECFTEKLTSLDTLCPNISEILTCISKVCPGESERGDLAVIHLRPLFKQICQGMEDYPDAHSCSSYTSCTETSIPAIPLSEETIQSYSSATDPGRWCRIVRGVSICTNATVNNKSCNLTSDFVNHVTLLQKNADTICSGVRDPCPAAAKCMEILFERNHSSVLISTCPNLDEFKSCVNLALETCGTSSQVEAEYSLTQIVDLFSEACDLMSKSQNLVKCKKAGACFKTTFSTHLAEMVNLFTDQTYWCSTVRRMFKCLSTVSPTCYLSDEITNKLRSLHERTVKYCPYRLTPSNREGSSYLLKIPENAGCSVYSSVLLVLFLLVGFALISN